MNKEVKYISYEESLSIYAKMIDASDGGLVGVRDEGGILASLDFVQNDMYYPSDGVNRLSCCCILHRPKLASPHNDLFHEW